MTIKKIWDLAWDNSRRNDTTQTQKRKTILTHRSTAPWDINTWSFAVPWIVVTGKAHAISTNYIREHPLQVLQAVSLFIKIRTS